MRKNQPSSSNLNPKPDQAQKDLKTSQTSIFEQESAKINKLISSIIQKKDYQGKMYINRYDSTWLLDTLNGDKLQLIESKFKLYEKKGVDIIDFAKILLESLEHRQEETVYITLNLVDIFKGIAESMNLKDHIKFSDFTSYIVEVGSQEKYFF